MPYKDGETGRNKAKERMKRMRERKGVTEGVTSEGCNMEGVTEYPANMKPLLTALGDIKQRAKLRAIYESLGRRDLTTHVHYGIHGVTFDVVGELLEAF
ncbi:hypothetical protein LCGC14_1963120 [marine sediment metagenome]|uniref:Uncharacterized protein n=1 Tax=marine sediment metagenome TaxID=412755 RepID=A0A0F9FDX1_9ZZZZ